MNKTVMTIFIVISDQFSRWIASVADFILTLFSRFAPSRTIRLVENENGELVPQSDQESSNSNLICDRIRIIDGQIDHANLANLEPALSGSQIELVLQSNRFIFRPLELPNRAIEFMDGIVRSQIDRLTPWSADDAAFGWSNPIEADAERMVITLAATPLSLIRPYVQAIADIGVHSIAVFTTPPELNSSAFPIKVWEERGRSAGNIKQIQQALITILVATSITAGVALGANAIISASFSAQQEDLARQISTARAAAGFSQNNGLATTVKGKLARRKRNAPLTVLALETLSKILPDNTYVTELSVEGNKLRLTGNTHDAASLIGLIEQSGLFTRATFFAPTTRAPSSSVEHFNIEAIFQPLGPTS
jgi:general secretion pathway protein L